MIAPNPHTALYSLLVSNTSDAAYCSIAWNVLLNKQKIKIPGTGKCCQELRFTNSR